MENLVSYQLDRWPFQDYHYVSDLIDFEGPILVHYQDQNKHAFYYWVEGNENSNRWLCFNVELLELYNYLYKKISLYEMMKNKITEPFFTVDINPNLEYHNFKFLLFEHIPETYFPDSNSYYLEDINLLYIDLFLTAYPNQEYNQFIEQRALDLVIEPKNSSYKNTVGLSDGVELMKNINNSYKSYGAYYFYKRFKDSFSSPESMTRAWSKMMVNIDPRITYASTNSFHISLATDIIVNNMAPPVLEEYSDFRRGLPSRYQTEILEVDLNNITKIDELIDKYDPISRRNIFGPLIKIINRPTTNLSFIDKNNNKSKEFSKIKFKNKSKLIPRKIKDENEQLDYLKMVFLTITLEVPENKNLETISKKDIQNTTLFSSVKDFAEREMQKIDGDSFSVIFNRPIIVKYRRLSDGFREVSFDPLNISVREFSTTIAFEKFIDEFTAIVSRDFISENPQNMPNNEYLEAIIEDIQERQPDDNIVSNW